MAAAALLPLAPWRAQAQGSAAPSAGNVVELLGTVWQNGQRLTPLQSVQTGDWLQTGAGSHLLIQLGDAALLLRQNTLLFLERGETLNTLGGVRLVAGAVSVAWNSRRQPLRQIGAGGLALTTVGPAAAYIELPPPALNAAGQPLYPTRADEAMPGAYACLCFGRARIATLRQRDGIEAVRHMGVQVDTQGVLRSASRHDHTDDEIAYLAALTGQQAPWRLRAVPQ